jgi:hypothetical protein
MAALPSSTMMRTLDVKDRMGEHPKEFQIWKHGIYPLVMTNIAMGNGPFIEVYLLKMVIFHGYVKEPDGNN